jgi:proline iminopeptidase
MAKLEGLSKDERTIAEHRIKTADGLHTLYVQEWGNPGGAPILFLHGGPGGGCDDGHKNYFDPKKHRVIFVDQRGAGNSKPYGSLESNNTQSLVSDLELIRKKLDIDKWSIAGRSWGSTLALCYAVEHTERIQKMIIGGVFLGAQDEVDWVEKGQFRMFFPEVGKQKHINPYTYLKLAAPTLRLDDRYSIPKKEDLDETALKIELFYTKNKCFLPEDYLLKNAKLLEIPVDIVQGRYDMMTPPKSAYGLHQKLSNSRIHWTIAGHAGSDRANYEVTKALLAQIE